MLLDWQKEIVASEALRSLTLISDIAVRLYPELSHAEAEAKLLEIPEMARLNDICRAKWRVCQDRLAA